MTEEFLHYIWQFKLYTPGLKLASGEVVEVLNPGIRNSDSGPDFFNARVRIEQTLWAGNVEIHILASDWFKHHHQQDKNYDNIILHVVWKNDKEVFRADGSAMPTIELDQSIPAVTWSNYLNFMASRQWIPCANQLGGLDEFVKNSWLETLLVARLERKALLVEFHLNDTQNDWLLVFYRLLALNMGFKLNNHAFEMLSASLPFSYLAKHADDLFQVEAMVFGQAGLLEKDFTDDYPLQLKKEYSFLRKKFDLSPLDAKVWRFMRLHPGNFPTIRLAQFAAIIHQAGLKVGEMFEASDYPAYARLLGSQASAYWETHYLFDKPSAPRKKSLGKESIDLLIINMIAPMLLAYARRRDDNRMAEKPVDLLSVIKGEENVITKGWAAMGFDVSSAAGTQALIELKTRYCDEKRCLNCRIGNVLLRGS